MIILLLLYTGLRVSELCDIKIKKIDFLTALLRVFGKGGKVREVPLKFEVIEAVKEYLAECSTNPFADSEYLIVGQRGALQRDAINTMLEYHDLLPSHDDLHTYGADSFARDLTNFISNLDTMVQLPGYILRENIKINGPKIVQFLGDRAYGSERQVERILFYIQNDEKVSKRNRMIILLLLYTGLRVSELCDIKVKNIDFLTAQLRVFGKGGKVREVPLKSEVVEVIKESLVERSTNPFADSEYLIIGQRGVLQRDVINTMLEKLTLKIGTDVRLKPHTSRHTFCTRLVKGWQEYNLSEINPIVVLEDKDTIEPLDEYELKQ